MSSNRYRPEELQMLFDRGVDLRRSNLHLEGDITEELVADAVRGANLLAEDVITIYVNSVGGDLNLALGLYDIFSGLDTVTFAYGNVQSAAMMIFLAGAKRVATAHTWGMVHNAWMMEEGEPHKMRSASLVMEAMNKQMFDILGERTNLTAHQWKMRVRHHGEVWMNAQRMLEWGVIDEIL